MENEEYYALITGASQGIGRAMAFECAKRGMNVLVIALDEPHLYKVKEELINTYKVKADCLGIDLISKDSPEQIWQWCLNHNYQVKYLINNAGFGRGGLFENVPLSQYYSMIELNNRAMVGLIYQFLPSLQNLPGARLLNMSSMEGTLPLPYKAVYTGSKHFVYALSLALREELKNNQLKVSVLCPGPTVTNEDGLERIKSQGWKAKIIVKMPDFVAEKAIHGLLKGQRIIIPGTVPRTIMTIMHWLPISWKMAILERLFRVYKDNPQPV